MKIMNLEVALDDKPFHVEHSGLAFRSQAKLFAEIGPCDNMSHVEHKIQSFTLSPESP